MPVKYIEGDLFVPLFADNDKEITTVLCHIVNSAGAWGAGFVIPLGKLIPKARKDYLAWARDESDFFIIGKDEKLPFELGRTQFSFSQQKDSKQEIVVANMLAQVLGGHRPIFYNHLARCMDEVAKFVLDTPQSNDHVRLVCPMFGAGLAGGDFNIIEKLIEDCWLRRGVEDITIYYLPGTLPDNWTPPS